MLSHDTKSLVLALARQWVGSLLRLSEAHSVTEVENDCKFTTIFRNVNSGTNRACYDKMILNDSRYEFDFIP